MVSRKFIYCFIGNSQRNPSSILRFPKTAKVDDFWELQKTFTAINQSLGGGGGQCWSKLSELFDYSNSKDQIIVFGIRIRSVFKLSSSGPIDKRQKTN